MRTSKSFPQVDTKQSSEVKMNLVCSEGKEFTVVGKRVSWGRTGDDCKQKERLCEALWTQ